MMKSVFFLFVALLYFENIVSKSVKVHENDFSDAEMEVEERSTTKAESEDRVIWKRIDANPHEGSFINKGESNSGNDLFMQQPTILQMMEENKHMTEMEITTEKGNEITFMKQPFSDNSLPEILDGENSISNDARLDLLPETSLSVKLEPQNHTNAIIIDFSNITGDAIIIDTFIENAISEDDLDEVSEMSKGEEIAFLHEMPTSSFEFLIDAQTRRNILLKELLGSQTVLSVEGDLEPANLHEHSLTNLHSHGNNFEELTMNDQLVPVIDKSEDEMSKGNNLNITTQIFAETEQSSSSGDIAPECPQPGWCIFWFLSQDTCAVNSHCLGSRICCKTGCSKTCVDV